MSIIAVIVPIYNVEPYLRRCIDSIIEQTFSDFELILIDDGSPDDCPHICDEYAKKDKRIHVIHQQNGGLSAARNAGLDWIFANSNSEWVTFIDSDDWVYPQYLEYLYRAVKEVGTWISVCGTVYEKKMFHEMRTQRYEVQTMSPEDYWVERNGDVSVAWEKLYKKELFENIRFPVGMIYEDEFTTYKLLFAVQEIAVLTNCLYIYYFSETSILRSNWNEKKFANVDAVLKQIEFFKRNGYKRAGRMGRKKLAYVLKLDYSMIRSEQEKYGQYKKILEKKLVDSYRRMYPGLSVLPWFRGQILSQLIIFRNTCDVYWRACIRKIRKLGA